MSSIREQVERLTEEVNVLKRDVKKLKKTLILDATKVEVWIRIDVAPEYMISSFGRVCRRRDDFSPAIWLDSGYYNLKLEGRKYKLHRLLAKAFIPNPESKPQVDHIDGDSTNNSLDNLRWATRVENSRNRKRRADNTSDYTGVTFHKWSGKYQARIQLEDGRRKHLGSFHTKEEAAAVYEEAARKEFGEFFREQ